MKSLFISIIILCASMTATASENLILQCSSQEQDSPYSKVEVWYQEDMPHDYLYALKLYPKEGSAVKVFAEESDDMDTVYYVSADGELTLAYEWTPMNDQGQAPAWIRLENTYKYFRFVCVEKLRR